MNAEKTIRFILKETLNTDSISNITIYDDLEGSGLDSINFVTIAVMLEETFEIQIPEDKLEYENFFTIERILKIIGELADDK